MFALSSPRYYWVCITLFSCLIFTVYHFCLKSGSTECKSYTVVPLMHIVDLPQVFEGLLKIYI